MSIEIRAHHTWQIHGDTTSLSVDVRWNEWKSGRLPNRLQNLDISFPVSAWPPIFHKMCCTTILKRCKKQDWNRILNIKPCIQIWNMWDPHTMYVNNEQKLWLFGRHMVITLKLGVWVHPLHLFWWALEILVCFIECKEIKMTPEEADLIMHSMLGM